MGSPPPSPAQHVTERLPTPSAEQEQPLASEEPRHAQPDGAASGAHAEGRAVQEYFGADAPHPVCVTEQDSDPAAHFIEPQSKVQGAG
jgi:hypothetical protein